jgi:N-acetylneuraminic acid mutarotase
MKLQFEKWIAICAISMMMSCATDSDDTVEDGNWVKRSSFDGKGRSGAVSFVIGDKAYVGLGFDGDEYLLDFWSYDPDQNFWQKVSDFPGLGRSSSVGFSIGDKGYIATGYNDDELYEELGDFWEFDSKTGNWTQLEDFAGSARYQAVGFAAGGYGYLGTGYDGSHLKDFWQFNPESGEWNQVVSLKGEKRRSGLAFVIDEYAYVGTGTNNGIYETDFWEFDPMVDDWSLLTDLDEDDDYAVIRQSAVAFELNGKGYITVGAAGANVNSTWEYTPGSDIWEEKTAFEGSGRSGAVAFTVNGRSFVALGQSGSSRFDDIWEFLPNETYDEDD